MANTNNRLFVFKTALIALLFLTILLFTKPSFGQCSDPTANRMKADISGPDGNPDCKIDIYDLAAFALDWLNCTEPNQNNCL